MMDVDLIGKDGQIFFISISFKAAIGNNEDTLNRVHVLIKMALSPH